MRLISQRTLTDFWTKHPETKAALERWARSIKSGRWMTLSEVQSLPSMEIVRPIRNDEEHRAALEEIDRLWGFPDGSAERDKLEVLAILVSDYEDTRWPIAPCTPRDILEYAVTDLGRSSEELGRLLGSPLHADQLLSGQRHVSLEDAQTISAAWKIPIQLLVAPYDTSRGTDSERAAQ